MERYTMLLDWKNQYCQNDYTIQSNLQIQFNAHQTINGVFHRIRTKNLQYAVVVQPLSCVWYFAVPWTVAHKAPLSLWDFPGKNTGVGYRSPGLPSPGLPSPGDLPGPGIDPTSPALTGKFFATEPPGKLTQEVGRC